jgi:hypothetical protein
MAVDAPVAGLVAGAPATVPVELAPDDDAWRMLRRQARTGPGAQRLLESWEVP